jgi:hypothetical protein
VHAAAARLAVHDAAARPRRSTPQPDAGARRRHPRRPQELLPLLIRATPAVWVSAHKVFGEMPHRVPRTDSKNLSITIDYCYRL